MMKEEELGVKMTARGKVKREKRNEDGKVREEKMKEDGKVRGEGELRGDGEGELFDSSQKGKLNSSTNNHKGSCFQGLQEQLEAIVLPPPRISE